MQVLGVLGLAALASASGPRIRFSPLDGSKIALPTAEQLAWQDKEMGVLIHYNMGTYLDTDGCNNAPDLVPDAGLFAPTQLDTDEWMAAAAALGAGYATLVAKHNCGFATWPSAVRFGTRDGRCVGYNYTVAASPVRGVDVVGAFVASARRHGLGHGLYYSVVVNNFLGVQGGAVRDAPPAPGQVAVSNETYGRVVLEQLTELWTGYGALTEIWLDGGFGAAQADGLARLLARAQPQAVVFNGCQASGACVSANSVRWIGNEAGRAPDPNWSTGLTSDGGDAQSPFFCPAECDTTLQTGGRWFYGAAQTPRPLADLIAVYHTTVGRNCVLELDMAPDARGRVPAAHAARYRQLGAFVRACYRGAGVAAPAAAGATPGRPGEFVLVFARATRVDRVVLMEDQRAGQVVRSYAVHGRLGPGADAPWTLLARGTSVGHKKIDVFGAAVAVSAIMVNATFVDTPRWRSVTAHLCDGLAAAMVAAADA